MISTSVKPRSPNRRMPYPWRRAFISLSPLVHWAGELPRGVHSRGESAAAHVSDR